MKYQKLLYFLQNVGKDPGALIFEDERTGLRNRRYLLSCLKHEIDWNRLAESPVSLLMIDIDQFSRINDQYGRGAGDQVLLHIAGLIESAAGKNDLAVRYAGDEFVLLLPGREKPEALKIAGELISGIHDNPFFSPEAGKQISVTISIGVATAPGDAGSGKMLINHADTALYHAGSSGGDRYADAATASRQAISYVDNAGIIGRKSHFEEISAALKKVSTGKNQFVIVDGAPGMGKTSFLDTVQRNLEKTRLKPVRISGVLQESFRPYYLVSYAVIVLMNQLEDKGISILESMDRLDLHYLPYIMPQLADEGIPLPENFPEEKDAIFSAFKRFLIKLIGARPLVLLIDDLQFSDPASLDMIRELLLDEQMLLFICATATIEKHGLPQAIPLELFRTAYSETLRIKSIELTPLAAEDIRKYINIIFPGITMPKDLTRELAEITQGNPLFIISILRKMITDRKIIQSERQWTVEKLEKGYFPRSFEEIVQQKMANINVEGKKFLDRASAFGESTSLSMLAGFADQESSEIYDFLKQAVDNGIVRSEFEENDENIRFSSKRVREVIYDGIQPEERKRIHAEIGQYHEKLYQQDLLPSAAFLVHHFKQSDNQEKARTYEQLMAQFNQRIYDFHEDQEAREDDNDPAEEEESFTGEVEEFADIPLTDEGLRHVPNLLRAMIVAIRNTRLYPADSKSVTGAIDQLMYLVRKIMNMDERVSFIAEKNLLLVNGQVVDTSTFQTVADKIVEIWNRLELKSLTFTEDVSPEELRALLEKISHIERKTITPGFWRRFAEENQLRHILFRQVKYKKINAGVDAGSAFRTPASRDGGEIPSTEGEHRFDQIELKAIQKVLGTFLGACSKLKLYPARGPVARNAVNQVRVELQAFLQQWPVLSVSRVENALLVNGIKIDTTGFETIAGGFLKLLSDTALSSITFTPRVSANELVDFMAAATQPGEEITPVFWEKLAAERQLIGILFNQNVYGIIEAQIGTMDVMPEGAGSGAFDDVGNAIAGFGVEGVNSTDDGNLPDRIRELFLGGNIREAEALVQELAEKYQHSETEGKIGIIGIFDAILNPADWRPTAHFIKLIVKPLLDLLDLEKNSEPSNRLFVLCHRSGEALILFGEYTPAAWIYTRLKPYAGSGAVSPNETHILGKPVGPGVTDALAQDLRSDDRGRQQDTFQLISSLGVGMLPLLIDIVKGEENPRVRHLAAELIKNLGAAGIDVIKDTVRGAIRPDERARILDVIDTVTRDLEPELALAFTHTNEVVRRSAFRLAERLNTPEIIGLLTSISRSGDTQQAVFAINTLGKLNPPSLIETLSFVLRETQDSEILIAGCRALGQIGDSAAVEPLSRILVPRRRFLRLKKYDTPVRVAAAFALAQIPDERANAILQSLKNDPDPRVRQVISRYLPEKN